MSEIPASTWSHPIRGTNLTGATLGEELGERPVLLAYLRHLG